MAQPHITVFFLEASRSIRIVWLLEELGLPYTIESSPRVNQKAPQEFKDKSKSPLGKFPVLHDGDLVVCESGAIVQYLCDKYDKAERLIPPISNPYLRSQVQTLVHAAEGTLALHGLSILYFRWQSPAHIDGCPDDALAKSRAETEEKLSVNVKNDLNWIEGTLAASTGRFLVGDGVTAADVMMLFSVQFVLARELGSKDGKWPKIQDWVKTCEATESYKRAIQKSGHKL